VADQTCKTCKWWDKRRENAPAGYCDLLSFESTPVASSFHVEITVDDDSNLDWHIQTGPEFGCVHHARKEVGNDAG
jgi:hypothetical protein